MNRLIIIALALLLASGLLFAQTSHCDQPAYNTKVKVPPSPGDNPNLKPRPGVVDECQGKARELGLNQAQQQKFDELRLAHQKTLNTLQAEIENLQMDIRAALNNDDFLAARRLTRSLFEKRLSLENARLDHLEAVLKELDAQQKDMFREHFLSREQGPQIFREKMQGMHKMQQQKQGPGDKCEGCQEHKMQGMHKMQQQMQSPGGKCEGCQEHNMQGMQKMQQQMQSPGEKREGCQEHKMQGPNKAPGQKQHCEELQPQSQKQAAGQPQPCPDHKLQGEGCGSCDQHQKQLPPQDKPKTPHSK